MLAIGSNAPNFELPDESGNVVSLSDYHGQNLILVFYPKDSTPGCTRQLCALRDDLKRFEKLHTAVLASNPGSAASHQRFIEKQGYNFPILVDADKQMATAYQALKPEGGIQRTVYIIDGAGKIIYAKQGLPPNTELEAAIKELTLTG